MKRNRSNVAGRGAAKSGEPAYVPQGETSSEDVMVDIEDPREIWALSTGLPAVQNLINLGWHRFLPPAVTVTFAGVAMAIRCGYKGDTLWTELNGYIEGVLRVAPTEEQKPYVDFVEKRFKDYYGEFEKTPQGVIKVLTDLGLVVLYQREGEDVMEISAALPDPEAKLGLCMVDVGEKAVFKARYRDDAGPRTRVTYEDVPAIRRMLNAGWARHLPPDLTFAFMAAASVSVGKCTGKIMWENVEDIWKAQREHKNPLMPKRKALEVEERFREEYARTFPRTVRGAVNVLIDLGLLVMSKLNDEDYLEVPEVLPTPDMRLFLSEKEKGLLAERLKITI